MKLERDRIKAKNEAIEAQMKAMQVRSTISYSYLCFSGRHHLCPKVGAWG